MILDERSEFCDATAVNTGGAATYLLGDVMDLTGLGTGVTVIGGTTVEYPGNSAPLFLVIQVDTSCASATGTIDFKLVSDSTVGLATSPTVHYTSGALLEAALTAGTTVAKVQLPQGTYERYLGITQTTATAAFTAGKINAFLTTQPENWMAAADNVS